MIIIISLNVTCSRHDIDENLRIWLETTNPLLPCGESGIVLAVRSQALVSSQIYACYVPKIPQGRTLSYYPCQNVDRTQPTFTFAATELSIVNKIGRLSVSMGV